MVIVDATVRIDYVGGTSNPYASWLNRELTRQRLGLTDLILCEVLQGIRDDVFTQVHHDLLRFQVFMTGGASCSGTRSSSLPTSPQEPLSGWPTIGN